MGKRILILGSGHIGATIAEDLSIDTNHYITVVDKVISPKIKELPIARIEGDLDSRIMLPHLMSEAHLVVNALPSKLAPKVWDAAVTSGTPLVDVSYQTCYENWKRWNEAAQNSDIPILCDVGVAPGLTNLVVGHVWADKQKINDGRLYVGGVSELPGALYGYATTWSLEDLFEEYTRPAQLTIRGSKTEKPALSGLEEIEIPGVGIYEAFLTDGLRTLLNLPNVDMMFEKTLRWPGHIEAIRPLLEDKDEFIKELNQCRDTVDRLVFYCEIDGRRFKLVDYPEDGLTAMQRTTALTCSTFTKLVAEKDIGTGIVTPEDLGQDSEIYSWIVDELAKYNVLLEELWPYS